MSQLEIEFGKGTAKYFPCDVSNAEQFEGILKLATAHSIRSLSFFKITSFVPVIWVLDLTYRSNLLLLIIVIFQKEKNQPKKCAKSDTIIIHYFEINSFLSVICLYSLKLDSLYTCIKYPVTFVYIFKFTSNLTNDIL